MLHRKSRDGSSTFRFVGLLLCLVVSSMAVGQATPAVDSNDARTNELGKRYLKHLLEDQKSIWFSPARARNSDLLWIVPAVGAGSMMVATDSAVMKHVRNDASRIALSHNIANFGVASMVAAGGGAYVLGHLTDNDHLRETALLSGEAAIDATGVTEAIKYATGRQRPFQDSGLGHFSAGGDSFPSDHSAVAWSIATVFAHEYPGIATKILAYGAASTISASRIIGRDHFPSDVFVGSTLGFLIGHYIYSSRHNPDLPGAESGAEYGIFVKDQTLNPANMASTYLPLDHWAYPMIERLAALGYIRSDLLDMRPWTRLECARLVKEASNRVEGFASDEIEKSYEKLAKEFAPELEILDGGQNRAIGVDSVYMRSMNISGPPLTNSYHFPQTDYNDYGRPFGEGANLVSGASVSGAIGPLAFYARGEYQHAATSTPLPNAARLAMSIEDGLPTLPPAGGTGVNRFRPLEAYVAYSWKNIQLSFGKQSFWWGPSDDTAFLFTNNAEPITAFRLDRREPFVLPGPLKLLGLIRVQMFAGILDGYNFIAITDAHGNTKYFTGDIRPHPYIHGEKITLKPTPNLQFGVSETTVFGGPGYPLTAHVILRSYGTNNALTGAANDPGDRRGGFDFAYRLPGLRNWVVLYTDAFTEDEINPIAYPRRSAMNPGIYLPKLPGLPKFDLRVEGIYTDLGSLRSSFLYYNFHYLSGYTNDGDILGSPIGRAATAIAASSTFWKSENTQFKFSFRRVRLDNDFLSGGKVYDAGVRAEHKINNSFELGALLNYEHWNFPILDSQARANVTSSIQLTYWPHWARKSWQ